MKFFLSIIVLLGALHSNGNTFAKELWVSTGSTEKPSVILMRHALAPGTGDPADFQIDDCRTQRNLSDEGRNQARQIGDLIRQSVSRKVRVYSSQWCRCLETARLLNLGTVQVLPFLNSFFESPHNREAQTRDLKQWIGTVDDTHVSVLVTHQVNITALTGVYPRSGEMVAVRLTKSGQVDVIRQAGFQ